MVLAVSNNGKNIKIRQKLRSSVFFSHEFQWWVGLFVLANQCRLPQFFWLSKHQSHTSNCFKALPLKWLCCGHFTLGCCEKQVRLVHGIDLERWHLRKTPLVNVVLVSLCAILNISILNVWWVGTVPVLGLASQPLAKFVSMHANRDDRNTSLLNTGLSVVLTRICIASSSRFQLCVLALPLVEWLLLLTSCSPRLN